MGLFSSLFKSKSDEKKVKKVKRAARVSTQPMHNIHVEMDPSSEAPLKVIDISVSGVAFAEDGNFSWPEVGSLLKGKFVIGDKEYSTGFEVIRKTDELCACKFTPDNSVIKDLFDNHFVVEVLGASMQEVNSDLLKPVEKGKMRWFRHKDDFNLKLVEEGDELLSFNIQFKDHHIQWQKGEKLQYGVLKLGDTTPRSLKEVAIIANQAEVPSELSSQIIIFIDQIKGLSTPFKQLIASQFEYAF